MAIWGDRATVRVEARRIGAILVMEGLPVSGSGDTFILSVRNSADGSLMSRPKCIATFLTGLFVVGRAFGNTG
jgi:hypothetical protein